jgi:hypothetical protein
MKVSYRVFDEDTATAEVQQIIYNTLDSHSSKQIYYDQCVNFVLKWQRILLRNTQPMLVGCSQLLHAATQIFRPYDAAKRQELANIASSNCVRVMCTLVQHFGMYMKSTENMEIAVGLLYLMRNGIKVGNILILPKIEQLHLFLPPENTLKTHFGIRSKYITDSENRAKHCLRQATEQQLRSAGFAAL